MIGVLTAAAALCALVYLGVCARPASALRSTLKTAAVLLLAGAAWACGAPVLLAVALLLCALGDLMLSRDGDTAFMAGIGAFAAGHLAYIALFLSDPASDPSLLLTGPRLWLAFGLVALGVVMARILAPRAGDLRFPVLAYIPIILGMGLAALTVPGQGALVWLAPAAFAFILSDLVLAGETFLLPVDAGARRWTPYAIWPLYWGAQLGFLAAYC